VYSALVDQCLIIRPLSILHYPDKPEFLFFLFKLWCWCLS